MTWLFALAHRPKEYNYCRKPERALNKCMFEKLVSLVFYGPRYMVIAIGVLTVI